VLAKEAGEEKRFLILETNYKIYAYTCELYRGSWRDGVGDMDIELKRFGMIDLSGERGNGSVDGPAHVPRDCRETRRHAECYADGPIANELEIAILNLFVDIRIRYPNLVVGKLDRQNVKAAMEKGISAHQVGFPSERSAGGFPLPLVHVYLHLSKYNHYTVHHSVPRISRV
jgi:hypothetical protein